MNKRRIVLALGLVVAMAFGGVVLAGGNPVAYDGWQSGNAASECSQIGDYTYAYKIDDWGWYWDGSGWVGMNNDYVASFADGHSNTITIFDNDWFEDKPEEVFSWSATSAIGAVIVKAGTGANVWSYTPQAKSDTSLYAYQGKCVSHVTFCWNPEVYNQWCSPGYWRQPHHLDSWEATGYSPDDLFYDALSYYPPLSNQGKRAGATINPTLWQVLQSPQWYGGDAFNAVGDLLSDAHPDVNFAGERVPDSCPLN